MTKQPKVKVSKQPLDFILLITVLLLLALGVVMVLSASSPTALSEDGDSYKYVKRQALFAVVGIVAMLFISKIDYKKYQKLYKLAYLGSFVLLLLVPLIGYEVGGAKRWINVFGIFSLQPSEIAKIGIVVFYAGYLVKHKDELKKLGKGFFKPLLLLAPIIFVLLFFQTHLSASVVIILIVAVMMIVAGCKLIHFVIFGSIGAVGGGLGLYILAKVADIGTFRIGRITSFLNPWADPQGSGWQIIQSLYAIGSGGLFGVGLRKQQAKIFVHIRTTQ